MRANIARTNRIVSIGRLVPFKSYNSRTIQAIKQCRDRGIPLVYHIYGDGEDRPALERLIKDLGLSEVVLLKGDIEYSKFQDGVQDALAFVGSGTAVIEASACGVPAIIGIEDDKVGNTYGFLHQTEGLAYHDANLQYRLTTIEERMAFLYRCSDDEYGSECARARTRAMDFSMDHTVAKWKEAWNHFKLDDKPLSYWGNIEIIMSILFNYVFQRGVIMKGFLRRHSKKG
jgi:glycosyltransferase involved in cell wall biosynthesis